MPTERELERAWRMASRAGEDCPREELRSAAEGALDSRARGRLADHLLGCPACADEYRLLRAVAGWAAGRRDPRRRALRWLAAAAAAVAVAAVVVVAGLRPREEAAPVVRSPDETTEIRSLLPDGARLPRGAFRLAWTPGPPGTRYLVRVLTEDLAPIHEAGGLEHAALVVPASALAGLATGATLVWTVEARLPDGRRWSSLAHRARLE